MYCGCGGGKGSMWWGCVVRDKGSSSGGCVCGGVRV